MRRTPLAMTIAAIALLWAGFAGAAPPAADQSFAAMAAQIGQAQLQTGQQVQQSATMPRLRQYGQTLVTDYAQFNDQLQQLAQEQNLDLPSEPTPYQHAQSQRLLGVNRDAFDREFLTQEVRTQAGYLARFQQEAKSGRDPALRKFAQDNVPMLRRHLLTAQSLLNQLPAQENTWRGQD